MPGSLVERLAELPDPRSRHGRQGLSLIHST
ncbi:hypothetical protein GobsT_34130 [Gemmata obscuriglobus]|nr:hypothetical protein GobsT_34130 [Gemmata obscuriglobus]VTS06816.1 unnamed protein product [Gemmata obscuriglobus UQM 2246]